MSKKGEQPENLKFDIMKNEFSKPYVSPVQIKTEYQNAEEVKTDFVRNEEVAAELGATTTLRALNLPTKPTLKMPKIEFSNVARTCLFKVCLEYFVYINFI